MLIVLIIAGVVSLAGLAFALAAFIARDDLAGQLQALRADLEASRRSIEALAETVEELRAVPRVPNERNARAIDALHTRLQQLLNDEASPALSGDEITDEELDRLFAE